MTYQAPHAKHSWQIHLKETHTPSLVDDAFLSKLVAELDNDTVTAIILRGSYARGDATSYSDIDLTRFVGTCHFCGVRITRSTHLTR